MTSPAISAGSDADSEPVETEGSARSSVEQALKAISDRAPKADMRYLFIFILSNRYYRVVPASSPFSASSSSVMLASFFFG